MGHWYLKKTKPSAPGALMAFYESNYPSFTKRGFSPTDHLCSFHLHINWKLLGVKKYLYVSNCSCSNALARCKRALFPQSSPPRRNHKLIADLEQWNSGAFGWYQLGRGGAVCQHSLQGAVCLCSLGQRALCWGHSCLQVLSSVSFSLPAMVEGTCILYCFCQVNIFNAPKIDADDFLQVCNLETAGRNLKTQKRILSTKTKLKSIRGWVDRTLCLTQTLSGNWNLPIQKITRRTKIITGR